jgi:hypothetical protein
MIYYQCDRPQCINTQTTPLPIELRGYCPHHAGGILIPENHRTHQFCSHECFVKWMAWALKLEGTTQMKSAASAPAKQDIHHSTE